MCSEKIAAWKEIIDCEDEHLSGYHSNSLVAAHYFACFRHGDVLENQTPFFLEMELFFSYFWLKRSANYRSNVFHWIKWLKKGGVKINLPDI